MQTKIFKISGMHCTACALNVDLDLEEVAGVKSAKTSYAKQEITVEYDPAVIGESQISASIIKAGYKVVK